LPSKRFRFDTDQFLLDPFESHPFERRRRHHGVLRRGFGNPRREIVGLQLLIARDEHHRFDDVFEFTHVAGPVVPDEAVQRLGIDTDDRLSVTFRELSDEAFDEIRDVSAAFAQRRQMDREDLQAIVEILPERALLDLLLEVFVGGPRSSGHRPRSVRCCRRA
jgi:hypothetical protein